MTEMNLNIFNIELSDTTSKSVLPSLKKFKYRNEIIKKLKYVNEYIQSSFDYRLDLRFYNLFKEAKDLLDFVKSINKLIYLSIWGTFVFSLLLIFLINLFTFSHLLIFSMLSPFAFIFLLLLNISSYGLKDKNKSYGLKDKNKIQIINYVFSYYKSLILELLVSITIAQAVITSIMILIRFGASLINVILTLIFVSATMMIYLYSALKIYYELWGLKIHAEDELLKLTLKNIRVKVITDYNKVIDGKLTSIGDYLRLESKNCKYALNWSDIRDIAVRK